MEAAHGIGQAAAFALAAAGATAVISADIDEAGAKASAEESYKLATNSSYKAKSVWLDVRDAAKVEAEISQAATEFGRLDYLINSAGVCLSCRLLRAQND